MSKAQKELLIKKLKATATIYGFTKEDLAVVLGVHRKTIHDWFRGSLGTLPTVVRAHRVKTFLLMVDTISNSRI
tara:strand:- start:9605 stop:9826 length:222 start_codon:yes stop_codon:yes gene_type:complete